MKIKTINLLKMLSKNVLYGVFIQCLLYTAIFADASHAQNSRLKEIRVDLRRQNASIDKIFEEIERETNFKFAYTEDIRQIKVDFDFRGNRNLYDVLLNLSQNSSLKFKLVNQTIFVGKNIVETEAEEIISSELVQTQTVTGTVTSMEENEPIPGVNIVEKGTSNGTVTDLDGNYTLRVSEGATLVFSSVGYTPEEIMVNNRSVIDVSMATDIKQLQELVVIGYGTVEKSDVTGALSSVSAEEITAYPALDMTQAIQGRAAGVQVQSTNGEPGAGFRIRIRGGTSINASSDPLYVVDGFPGGAIPPPEDIQSIEILKDASATAIYGSRGANGVVLITTKSGKAGEPLIEFSADYSTQGLIKELDVLNGQQFAEFMNDLYLNDGGDPDDLPYANPASYGAGTDWQDIVFRNGTLQNYQVSVSGGSEDVKYYVSSNYFDQSGIITNSNFDRITALSNIDITASDNLKLGANLYYARTNQAGVRTQEGSGGATQTGVISGALKFEPTQGIFNENGEYTISGVGDPHDNPYALANELVNERKRDYFQGNFYGELQILENLSFRTTIGTNISNGRNGEFMPTTLVGGRNTGGTGSLNNFKNTSFLNENYLNYNQSFGGIHNISVMGGYSYQSYSSENATARNQNFISNSFSYWNLGGGSDFQNASSNLSEWEMSSYYARVNYSLLDRYMLTFTGRYDGSSRFGRNNKWAFFPSGALAWNVAEEPFMQDQNVFNNLKLRVSYGETGNTEIGTYQSLARFSPVFVAFGGSPFNAVRPTDVANNDLTWESTSQWDFGVDMGFLEDRITVTADYYYMKTTDLLYNVPLPEYSGYGTSLQNIGAVENTGFEFSLNSTNLTGDFAWTTDLNLSFNRNEILELAGGDVRYSTAPGHLIATESQILRVGEPVGAFYGWVFDGIYGTDSNFDAEPGKQPGDVKYLDLQSRNEDGDLVAVPDGTVNNDDRVIIGNPHPDLIWGLNNDFKLGNFDMNVFITAVQGNDMLNFTRMELEWLSGKSNQLATALNRWTPENQNTNIPRASASHRPEVSSRWVEDGSFIRLKNLSLGYNLPEDLIGTIGVQKARVFVSAQNLLTITDYTGYDPEVSYQDSNRNVGLDYASYPNVRSYTVGINVGF